MLGPLLPFLSDTPEELERLMALLGRCGVGRIRWDTLNPRPGVWASYRRFLEREYPGLVEPTARVLFDRQTRAEYTEKLARRVREAAGARGLAGLL